MSDDSSWPPRVRESHEPDQPRSTAPQPPSPPPELDPEPQPESIGAVDHGETQVNRRAAKRLERAQRRVEKAQESADRQRSEQEDLDEDDAGPRERLIKGLLIGGLVLMTVLSVVLFAVLWANSDVGPDEVRVYLDDQRPVIEDRARTAVDILINYDSTNIQERRDEMLSVSTGSFRDDYEEFTQTLGDVLQEAGASSRGAILEEPRVSFTSPEEADVIVRTEQIAQTKENPTGRKIEYIMRLGLIDTQGGWKVDNIEILSDEVT